MKGEKEYHIALGEGDVGRYVILPGDPKRTEKIAGYFDNVREMAFNREFRTFTGTIDGIKVSATSTGIGCPSAAICVEELIRCGADTFIRVGTAGGLQPHIKIGDLVITTASVRDEGTTVQYVPIQYPAVADYRVCSALKEAAQKLGFPHHIGIGHTKDAFYTEGSEDIPLLEENRLKWKVWERANVLATAMEASALYVISSIRRVRAGEVLAVIGLTYKDEPIVSKKGVEEAIKTALEAVKILAAKEGKNEKK
ncbi:MAG: uridine phosphorylase [Spirochaetes bacterium]|nr:MAG: uridine phosphorylase [Spirochaetota bacterium]